MSEVSSSDLKKYLEDEVAEEVAETGHCGVYELVWALRGRENCLTDYERVELAKRVAQEMLDGGRLTLRTFEWPSNEPISGTITLDDVTEEDWLNVASSWQYPALVEPG